MYLGISRQIVWLDMCMCACNQKARMCKCACRWYVSTTDYEMTSKIWVNVFLRRPSLQQGKSLQVADQEKADKASHKRRNKQGDRPSNASSLTGSSLGECMCTCFFRHIYVGFFRSELQKNLVHFLFEIAMERERERDFLFCLQVSHAHAQETDMYAYGISACM